MQLERSLFSFYKVFVRKTPFIIWITIGAVLLCIMCWQTGHLYSQNKVYNFDQCMMQYFNVTRKIQSPPSTVPSQQNTTTSNSTDNSSSPTQPKKPYFLQPSYYNILNETSTIKIYLSDKIEYKEGEPNCKIILNTQKIRDQQSQSQVKKKDDQTKQIKEEEEEEEEEKQKQKVASKLLQQIDDAKTTQYKIKVQDQNGQKQIIMGESSQTANLPSQQSSPQNHDFYSVTKRSQNTYNFDEISDQQKSFLLTQHSFMHITANQHVVYLDQNNEFEQKHNVQIHAIILSKQQVNEHPQIFGISSKLWRLHGNEDITQNANMLRSIGESFFKAGEVVKTFYTNTLNSVNLLIAMKRFVEQQTVKPDDQKAKNDDVDNGEKAIDSAKDQQKQGNLVKEDDPTPKPEEPPTPTTPTTPTTLSLLASLPTDFLPSQQITPLNQLKLYFHYPQTLRVEDISKLASFVQKSSGIFYKIFQCMMIYGQLLILSGLIGLLVRYLFFWIITGYLFLGGCWVSKQWGWVYKYFALIRNRFTRENAFSSAKMVVMLVCALVGSMAIFTLGTKYILQNLIIIGLPFSQNYYAQMLLKNYFIIEMFYYVFCRTRTSLKYFPFCSAAISVLIMMINDRLYCYHISWLMNMHLLGHLFLMSVVLAVENYIGNSQYFSQYTPSQEKPRALYYLGYDISWQNTLPPIWTYFTTSFDLKFIGQRQRALINRDYQLLYGRLLGMSERQELPEDEENAEEEEVRQLNQNLSSEGNQMMLVR